MASRFAKEQGTQDDQKNTNISSSLLFNKELVKRILWVGYDSIPLSCYTFVDLICELKPVFLNNLSSNTPTLEYIYFMKYLLSILEKCSVDQLKTIERFCLRMDEDALTGIVKYHNKSDDYITYNSLCYLLKKYKVADTFIMEIINGDHVNISNSLINMLAKTIRFNKPICKYASKCYRKNNDHLKTYFH